MSAICHNLWGGGGGGGCFQKSSLKLLFNVFIYCISKTWHTLWVHCLSISEFILAISQTTFAPFQQTSFTG